MKIDKSKKDRKRINPKVVATSIVAITLIGIVGISLGKNSGKNPFNTGIVLDSFSSVESVLNSGYDFVKNGFKDVVSFKKNANLVKDLQDENKELTSEIIELQTKLDDAQSLDNLKKALNFVDEKYVANEISAKVVSKNDGNWYTSFVIGAGSSDGVKVNSLVMNESGLVGMIYEVSQNYSKAISLLDTTSSVSFKLAKDSKYKGIITIGEDIEGEADNRDKGLLEGYLMDSSYNVLPGDTIVTSGLGLYPENIVIGEISKVVEDKDQSLKYVVIKPNVDFKNIDNVLIVEPRNID